MNKPKVIVIGGGFGGLSVVKSLRNASVDIILIDKTNHHLFQPLLYQVATAALSPGDIAVPIREILRNQDNVKIILGEVTTIDRDKHIVKIGNQVIHFDYLIVATGSRHSYFQNPEWESFAPGLKTISDALLLREKTLLSFEKAEAYLIENREIDKEKINLQKYLTFVIVGGGPTGVELAGAIAEISRKTMLKDFRMINPSETRIILVEYLPRILPTFHPSLSEAAKKFLESMGVTVLVNRKVTGINEHGVKVDEEYFETQNIIWAAGNTAMPLLKTLNTETDKNGRIIVEPDLSIKQDHNIFVIGDACYLAGKDNKPLPGVAPVAIQEGKYIASIIKSNKRKEERKSFNYFDKGNLATIGRAKAIAEIGKIKLRGYVAWLTWSFIHILYLIGFRNRYRVMIEWIWLYFTRRNGIRLITNKTADFSDKV